MLILGVILIVVDLLLLHTGFVYVLGIVLAVVGLVLLLAGAVGHPVAGRRYWY